MCITSRLHRTFAYAKYCLLSRALTCGCSYVANSSCHTQLADLPIKQQTFQWVNSPFRHDKWPGENGEKVASVFQRMKYIRLLKAAIRVGGPYPEQNPKLASLIEEVKKNDISIPTEQVIERALNPRVRNGIYEVTAPSAILLILQYGSTDISLTEHTIKEVCEKYDFSFVGQQRRRHVLYDQKGVLMASLPHGGMQCAEAMEMAVKAGAESVFSKVDTEEKTSFEVYCNPSDLHQVKRQLENSFDIEEAFVCYIPKSPREVSDSVKEKMAGAIVDFSNALEIEMIYENVK